MGIGAERLPLGIQFVGSAGEGNRMLAGVSDYQSRTRRHLERGPAGDLGWAFGRATGRRAGRRLFQISPVDPDHGVQEFQSF